MTVACLEHVNLTVANPDSLAKHLCDLFDWKVRWSGEALEKGYTVHVGSPNRYLALYTHPKADTSNPVSSYLRIGVLNHIGVTVNDLNVMESRVKALGFTPNNHRDYGVCKSFYFMLDEYLEIEVIQTQ